MLHLVSPIHPATHPHLSLDFSANSRLTASARYNALRIIHIALDAASPLLFISCKLFFSSLCFLELLQDMSCSLCFLGHNCAFGFVNCSFAVILFSTQVKRSMVVLHAVLQVHIWSPNNVQMRTLWRLSLAYFSTRFLSCCHCLKHRNQAAVCSLLVSFFGIPRSLPHSAASETTNTKRKSTPVAETQPRHMQPPPCGPRACQISL